MPVFNVKVKHGAHEAMIPIRADSADGAKASVISLHAYDYLNHFKSIPYDDKKHHANSMSPYATKAEPGAALNDRTIVSIEPATEACPGCGGTRPVQ